tara:strand:+ start:1889 stop:2152 length:264 start_codon:yes stop_codon:yes gene_type:complete
MNRILTIVTLLCTTPAWAKDLDSFIQLRLSESKIEASYQYGNRGLAERLVNVYCQEQFGKSGNLQRGACTKMLPMEANSCIARGLCE